MQVDKSNVIDMQHALVSLFLIASQINAELIAHSKSGSLKKRMKKRTIRIRQWWNGGTQIICFSKLVVTQTNNIRFDALKRVWSD